LNYRIWDVDLDKEIEILVNGTRLAYATYTGSEQWSSAKTLTLPDNLVNNSSQNSLTFNNRFNPSNIYWWGVKVLAN